MLKFGNKEFRNLEEQVAFLTSEYQGLADGVSSALGFMPTVLGVYETVDLIPDGSYDSGDTFLIGAATPYHVYVYTTEDKWQDVGEFPVAGPKGAKGDNGSQILYGTSKPISVTANDGDYYINTITGDWYINRGIGWIFAMNLKGEKGDRGPQGLAGPQGPQGERGPQGPAGEGTAPSAVIISAPSTAVKGTLTSAQLQTLQESDSNYIMFNNELYALMDKGHRAGFLTYSHVGRENNRMWIKTITITISTLGWVLNSESMLQESDIPAATTIVDMTRGEAFDATSDEWSMLISDPSSALIRFNYGGSSPYYEIMRYTGDTSDGDPMFSGTRSDYGIIKYDRMILKTDSDTFTPNYNTGTFSTIEMPVNYVETVSFTYRGSTWRGSFPIASSEPISLGDMTDFEGFILTMTNDNKELGQFIITDYDELESTATVDYYRNGTYDGTSTVRDTNIMANQVII